MVPDSSRNYLEVFGVGVTEWCVIAMLATEPGITACRIRRVIGLDKAAASRALRTRECDGYVETRQDNPAVRRKLVSLTERGRAIHSEIIRMANARERILVSDLAAEEVETLAGLLRRVLAKIPAILEPPESDR